MISGKTSLVGLLGNPVDHSLSPVIQNAAIQEMGLDWCYIAMKCEPEHLTSVTKALHNLNCQGLNITIPHKQKAINICDHISPLAKKIGAINTLVPNEKGGWNGLNTDVEGFLAPLETKKWAKKKAIVLGCGGSARAVTAGLEKLKLNEIAIVGRKKENLTNFLFDIEPKAIEPNTNETHYETFMENSPELNSKIQEADLIINTTPVGMAAKNNQLNDKNRALPFGEEIWQHLRPKTTLYDLIYTPKPTAWLALGGEIGCNQIDGLEMLIQQGAASLRIWSNYNEIPIDVMRIAANNHLSS